MNKKKSREKREKFLQMIWDKYGNDPEYNIYPEPMTDAEFVQIIMDYFLGENYYVADPISHKQVNTVVACEIISRYLSKY